MRQSAKIKCVVTMAVSDIISGYAAAPAAPRQRLRREQSRGFATGHTEKVKATKAAYGRALGGLSRK